MLILRLCGITQMNYGNDFYGNFLFSAKEVIIYQMQLIISITSNHVLRKSWVSKLPVYLLDHLACRMCC